METNRLVLDGQKYIAVQIDGSIYKVLLGSDVIHTDGDHIPYWNGKPFLLEGDLTEYELPTMSASVKGGATVGDRLSMSGTALSANQQTWTDIINGSTTQSVTAPSLGIFSNATTQFQSLTEIQQLFENFEAVKDVFIADGTEEDESNNPLGYANGDFVVVRNDGTQEALFNTIADVDLSIRTGAELDPEEEDSSINQDGIYLVVNFGTSTQTFTDLTSLIPTFNGNDGTHILTTVSGGVIAAQLKNGTITQAQLHADVNTILNSVQDKMELQDAAVEGNVAVFDDAGQAIDGGVALEDLATKQDLDDLIDNHTHDGTDSKRVNYGNLTYKPVLQFVAASVEDSITFPVGADNFDFDYVITIGADAQKGTLRVFDGHMRHINVVDTGSLLDITFSLAGNGTGIVIVNNESGNISVEASAELQSKVA